MSARLWTSDQAAAATGGRLEGPAWEATGVSIDTRTLAPGDLFVALEDQRDGHDFVADALAKGGAAALVSRRPEGLPAEAPLLVVPDVLKGLGDLARVARARSRARVVAITGSVGKTSTKEMLRAALADQGRVHAAEASYNNHWGVPLTLARLAEDADFAVIEIGMNHPGEIAPLARLARPHVGLITTIAPAHMEAFAGLEDIAREKASLFEGLEAGGTAILPGDLAVSPILAAAAPGTPETFGRGESCTHRLIELGLAEGMCSVRAEIGGEALFYRVQSPGAHFAENALGALAAARALGADLAHAVLGLGSWRPPEGRGRVRRIALDPVMPEMSFTLIDDAFNANPASMAAALEVLAATAPRDGVGRIERGRRIAILGDMLELGSGEEALHGALADLGAMDAVDLVHCVGPRMRRLHARLPAQKRGRWVETAEELCQQAHQLVDAGDVVLVKGSKGSRVSRVAAALAALAPAGVPDDTPDDEMQGSV